MDLRAALQELAASHRPPVEWGEVVTSQEIAAMVGYDRCHIRDMLTASDTVRSMLTKGHRRVFCLADVLEFFKEKMKQP